LIQTPQAVEEERGRPFLARPGNHDHPWKRRERVEERGEDQKRR
jgi:hypothetical protein